MATFYVQSGAGGSATNSGSTDQSSANLSGSNATGLGTSTITLDGSPDLSGLVTSGATQSTIYLNNATNANQKIFKITAFDNGAKTVTVSGTPTGSDGGTWAIGGRLVWTPANIEAALAAGDTVIFNDSPATRTSTFITLRASGDSTSGFITIRGKTGVRPVLNITSGAAAVITANSQTNIKIQNLELDQDATGDGISATTGWVIENVKISDANIGISANGGIVVIGCEITGTVSHGISVSAGNLVVVGSYIHDCSGSGVVHSGTAPTGSIVNNIIDTNSARGVYLSGAASAQTHGVLIMGNTIYGNGDSGIQVDNANIVATVLNNILSENGNAAGEYNIEWATSADLHGYHGYNVLFHSGGGGAANLSNYTANSTELTTDPGFTNPASGDFTIGASSPAANAGFPGAYLGGGTAYRDIGAMQRQVSAGGGVVGVIGG